MKLQLFAILAVAITVLVCVAAAPGRHQNPPTVRPQPPPRPIRVRRYAEPGRHQNPPTVRPQPPPRPIRVRRYAEPGRHQNPPTVRLQPPPCPIRVRRYAEPGRHQNPPTVRPQPPPRPIRVRRYAEPERHQNPPTVRPQPPPRPIRVRRYAEPERHQNPPTVRPQPPPRPIRVRRDVATGGAVATNPNGGHDVKLEIAKGLGTPDANVIGSAFAMGNTKGGPVTTGGSLAANVKGLGASITKEHTPGISDTLTKSASANVLLNENNRLDASIFKADTKLSNGFEFEKNGGSLALNNAGGHGISIAKETIPGFSDSLTKSAHATFFNNGAHSVGANVFDTKKSFDFGPTLRETGGNLNWAHTNGHAANLGLSKVHDFGTKFNYGASSNLFTSADRQTSLDFNAGGSRWLNGPLSGRNDFNTGFGLSHRFSNWG
ncbi:PREDICTED: sarcotoxin II-3-like [Rhagoletis zephyria]|uniref:sarcotoxin II-3-like n=1 Tax=Rhagoletis zephyria TaxID=28612 RepID=UPI0008114333|nr:PREDICTED: sarcotoxin II-3-like [Rhagoletis zephyria]